MHGTVCQRPQGTGRFSPHGFPAEQPSADPEENPPAEAQGFGLRFVPWEWLQQRQPGVFELCQLAAADAAAEQLAGDGTEARLARRRSSGIEFLQALAPPGEADRAECRLGRGGNNICQREIEVPEGGEGGPGRRRSGGKRRQTVAIERPLSDR